MNEEFVRQAVEKGIRGKAQEAGWSEELVALLVTRVRAVPWPPDGDLDAYAAGVGDVGKSVAAVFRANAALLEEWSALLADQRRKLGCE